MPATRDDAIRQARRLGDPAAICAALAVTSAWEADEGRGRELAERFVDEGLLTSEQVRRLVGAELACTVSAGASPRRAEPASDPLPVSVLDIDLPSLVDSSPPVAEPGDAGTRFLETSPKTTDVGAAEEPGRAPSPPTRSRNLERPGRVPLVAAAVLGVAVALASWFAFGHDRSQAQVPSPPRHAPAAPQPSSPPRSSVAPRPSSPPEAPASTRQQPAPQVPQAAEPPAPRAPIWAPGQRQVREGDSSAVHDRLSSLAHQIQAEADPSGVSFEARRLLRRAPKKDRIVRWVELTLGRFHTVANLRLDGANVAWAGE